MDGVELVVSDRLRKNLWFMYLTAMVCWSINAYMFIGQLYEKQELFASKIDGRPYISDFVNGYAAGVLARECLQHPVNIYDREVQGNLQRKLVAPVVPESTFYNQYPPLMFLYYLPFSFVNMGTAWIILCVLGTIAAVATTMMAIVPYLNGKFTKTAAIAILLYAFPTWLSFRLGQTSLLLFPVLLSFWHLFKKKKYGWCAVLASVLIIKMQYLPIVAAALIAVGGWRALLALIGASSFFMLGSGLLVRLNNLAEWPRALLSNEGSEQVVGVSVDKMQNLRGELFLLLGSDGRVVHIVSFLFWVICGLALFFAWRRLNVNRESTFFCLASITTLAMLVFSPHTHMQDYMIALLPCAWLYIVCMRSPESVTQGQSKTIKWTVLTFPVLSWIFYMLLGLFQLIKIQPFALWAVAVIVYICLVMKGESQISASHSIPSTNREVPDEAS